MFVRSFVEVVIIVDYVSVYSCICIRIVVCGYATELAWHFFKKIYLSLLLLKGYEIYSKCETDGGLKRLVHWYIDHYLLRCIISHSELHKELLLFNEMYSTIDCGGPLPHQAPAGLSLWLTISGPKTETDCYSVGTCVYMILQCQHISGQWLTWFTNTHICFFG